MHFTPYYKMLELEQGARLCYNGFHRFQLVKVYPTSHSVSMRLALSVLYVPDAGPWGGSAVQMTFNKMWLNLQLVEHSPGMWKVVDSTLTLCLVVVVLFPFLVVDACTAMLTRQCPMHFTPYYKMHRLCFRRKFEENLIFCKNKNLRLLFKKRSTLQKNCNL